MPDYQRIADDIRTFVEGEDQTRDAQLESLAQEYADCCKAANTRLRRCGDLLRRGLRSEAIHLAQEQPDLLDFVAALDLPGLDLWENACSMYGLAKPVRLMMDVAAELNEAYALEEPLQANLEQLRLLAVARAAPAARLMVTRRLRALDPDTAHWTTDVTKLERVCLSTVHQEANGIIEARNPMAARRLAEALLSPDWIEPPPRDVISALTYVEMQGMVQELAQMQAEGNQKKVGRLIDALQKTAAKRNLSVPEDFAAAVAEARGWLTYQSTLAAEQEKFHALCGQLESTIQRGTTHAALESLYARVRAYNLPLPSRLQEAYDRAERDLQLLSARAKRRNLLIIAAVALLILGGTFYGLQVMRENTSAQVAIAKLNDAASSFDFAGGEKIWDSLKADSPNLITRKDVQTAHEELQAAAAAEAKRVQDMEDALVAAQSANPVSRYAKFAAAEKLARLDSERLRIREARHDLESPKPARPDLHSMTTNAIDTPVQSALPTATQP